MTEYSLLGKVRDLFQFTQVKPLPPQLAAYLSENFCPFGEVAGVSVGRLHDDGQMVCEIALGFAHNELITGSSISLFDDRPASHVMRSLHTVIMEKEELTAKFSRFVPSDYLVDFVTAVIIPVNTRSIYGFALQNQINNVVGFSEYVDCVRSILMSYENNCDERCATSELRKPLTTTKELTVRQQVILGLLKAEKTNATIATELGNSESLIRQETIIIYRKLGVNGRRDLIPEMQEH